MSTPYRVLQVEDSIADALFNVRQLQREGLDIHSVRVETAPEMRDALEGGTWDFIICDYRLPQLDCLKALAVYKESNLDIPFIVVSGLIGEAQAVKLIKAGANDCVMKDNLAELGPAVRRELKAAEERLIYRRLAANDALLASMVKDCHEAIFGTTLDGSVVAWNKGAERLYGYTASEMVGGPAAILESPTEALRQSTMLQKLRCGEHVPPFETVHLRKNKSVVQVSVTMSPLREAHGRVVGGSTVAHDISVTR